MSGARASARWPSGRWSALAPLFLVSFSAVAFEIALTRFFAVVAWSEYGYWVISIVMAGFALSGVALALAREAAERQGARILAWLPAALVAAAAIGFRATAANPFNPLQLQNPVTWAAQLWNIAGYYAALLPFFFLAGLFIGLSFVLNARRIGIVYGFDLAGAGAGAAAVTALMFVVPPLALVPALLVPLAASAAFLARRQWRARLAALVALAAAEALLLGGPQPGVNEFKPIYAPLHTPGARALAARLSPRGQYLLLDDFTERVDTDVSNDAGQLGLSGPPRALGLYRDGTRIAALPGPGPALDVGYAGAALDAAPYTLLAHPRALLVGASGGFRIAELLALGAAHVDALEPDPVLGAALRSGLGPSPAPVVARDTRVAVRAAPPIAAASSGGPYDLIDISADFLDAAEANATAFSVEALQADLGALAPGGIVSVPVSIRDFPVYALRVLATARAALLRAGVTEPGRQVVVYRSAWGARVLLSNRAWDAARIAALRSFSAARSFDLSYYPGIDVPAARAGLYNDLPAVSFDTGEVGASGPDDSIADEAGAVLAGVPTASQATFSLAPVTLDRPFFYAALRLSRLRTLLARLEMLPQAEVGALVNLAVLAQAGVIAALVLLVPLLAPGGLRAGAAGMARVAVYFPALGLGFLFIEIALIAQASLWLDDQTGGFALVLTGMLVCSGLGSLLSARVGAPRRALGIAVLGIVLWCVAAWAGLRPLALATLGWTLLARAGLLLAMLAPVSVALGLPFPLGLARVGTRAGSGVLPWAWALNGAFSVVATPLAALLSRTVGYDAVLLGGGVLYAVALASFPIAQRLPQWHDLPACSPVAD